MSKYVNLAALLFENENYRDTKNARKNVITELREKMKSFSGTGLDLLVISEGVEAMAIKMNEAESLDSPGTFLNLYMDFARKEKCHVVGSIKLKKNKKVYNSIAFIDDNGKIIGSYSKTFLTAGEIDEKLASGSGAVVLDTKIGRLGGAICFDLNFCELRSQYAKLKPDIMIFSSMFHGGLQQSLWAYDCRSFFVSALPFHGGGILDPHGLPVSISDCYNKNAKARINLDRAIVHLDYNFGKFPDIERKYGREVRIHIPPNIGSVMIYSESENRSAMDIVKEFGLELLDDYFARLRKKNRNNAH